MKNKKETVAEYKRKYYLTHKKKIIRQNKIWKEKNIDKVRAYTRVWAKDYRKKCLNKLTIEQLKEWRKKNNIRNTRWRRNNLEKLKNYHRNNHLIKRYNITQDIYLDILKKQGGGCDICGKIYGKKSLFVDHNHKTNKVRGLLCAKCNFGLGSFLDNPEFLLIAYQYLKKWE